MGDAIGIVVASVLLVTLHIWRVRVLIADGVLLVLRTATPQWIDGLELVVAFGPQVYTVLRRLEAEGHLERRTTPGGAERGFRDRASYRWALPGGR